MIDKKIIIIIAILILIAAIIYFFGFFELTTMTGQTPSDCIPMGGGGP